MDYQELSNIIFKELKLKLESHKGLSVFAKKRAKFEGWLKIELCDILIKNSFKDIVPEDKLSEYKRDKRRIDVTFKNWAIELKTISTNFKCSNVEYRRRPITKNIKSVIKDIMKLKKTESKNKAIFFIVFPAKHNDKKWQYHLNKIKKELCDMKHYSFKFNGNPIPGIMYFGLI